MKWRWLKYLKYRMNSFSIRLFASYLMLIGIIVFISYKVYDLKKKEAEIFKVQFEIKEAEFALMLLYKANKGFFESDLIDTNFYKSSTSKQLLLFDSLYSGLMEELNRFKNDCPSELALSDKVDTLLALMKDYKTLQDTIVALQLQRGFKNFGFEGKMRENIHKLERSMDKRNMASVLALRRTEKDYFLRKDMAYVQNLTNQVQALLQDGSLTVAQRNWLKDYAHYFNAIVSLETTLGQASAKGLRQRQNELFEKAALLTADISSELRNYSHQQLKNLYDSIVYTIAIMLAVSLFISFIFTYLINRPLAQLAAFLKRIVKNKFVVNEKDRVPIQTGIYEFKVLEEKTELLVDEIQRHVGAIEIKNQTLTSVNEELYQKNVQLQHLLQELKNKEELLSRSNELKDKFLSIISHDIRSPLTTLKGYLDIIINYPDAMKEEEKEGLLQKVYASVNLQLELLSNLLEWARTKSDDFSFKPSYIPLEQVLRNVLDLCLPTAAQKQISVSHFISNDVIVYADRNMLELIFRNLISNAIKFTPNQGKIDVLCQVAEDTVHVAVRDSGVGMSAEALEILMSENQIYTTYGTNKEKGTGFGLLFCREFIRRNGGEMTIVSAPGEGTTVSFTIPKHEPEVTKNESQHVLAL